jgi:hypothetical protein
VQYLQGACLDRDGGYPVLRLCRADEMGPDAGVGLSANGHFSNANWVGVPGRAFFFSGGLPQGATLTRAAYARTQAQARQLGLYDGIRFHPDVFDDMPRGMTRTDWKYEVSIASDYAIDFGRGRYCARLPVERAQMARIVGFLNARNAAYRDGPKQYESSIFQDSCAHLAHNALATADFWGDWPTDRFIVAAVLDFPVPKNEFVNLMRRGNDLPITDPAALFADPVARRALLRDGWLPTEPGVLAIAVPPRADNAVYDTDLPLIFYDVPVVGRYQARFDRIFTAPRFTDPRANLRHFAALYAGIEATRQPLSWWQARRGGTGDAAAFASFYGAYYAYVARMRQTVARQENLLNAIAQVDPARPPGDDP